MKTGITRFILLLAISAVTVPGCTPKAKYERKLKHELASGMRYDSLFMGLYLGMPQKDFYTHCWELNKQGLIKQGSTNTTVEYQVKDELKHPATMNFYPNFVQGKISEMPVRFNYKGWAPWNKALLSDSLQLDLLNWYKKVYGKDFMKVEHPTNGAAYIKLDGNRRITIFREGDLNVWAVFTDMLVKAYTINTVPDAGYDHLNDSITDTSQ